MALVCDVYCDFVTFPFGLLGQVLYLIVSILDPCCLSYSDLILYVPVPVNSPSVMSGRVLPGGTGIKQRLLCLAQGRKSVTPVRLKPTALRYRV